MQYIFRVFRAFRGLTAVFKFIQWSIKPLVYERE